MNIKEIKFSCINDEKQSIDLVVNTHRIRFTDVVKNMVIVIPFDNWETIKEAVDSAISMLDFTTCDDDVDNDNDDDDEYDLYTEIEKAHKKAFKKSESTLNLFDKIRK